jgi:hypothetical protein
MLLSGWKLALEVILCDTVHHSHFDLAELLQKGLGVFLHHFRTISAVLLLETVVVGLGSYSLLFGSHLKGDPHKLSSHVHKQVEFDITGDVHGMSVNSCHNGEELLRKGHPWGHRNRCESSGISNWVWGSGTGCDCRKLTLSAGTSVCQPS